MLFNATVLTSEVIQYWIKWEDGYEYVQWTVKDWCHGLFESTVTAFIWGTEENDENPHSG